MADSDDLLDMFESLERQTEPKSRDEIIRAPFGWPGGKSKSLDKILPHLPYTDRFVEAFGGSGAVLLARRKVKMEVYNDRYGGVTHFYQCLRNPVMMAKMCDWLNLSVHSREEFVNCKATWQDCDDPVERACRWFYMIRTSFGSLGRNYGRSTSAKTNIARQLSSKIPEFPLISNRLVGVQVENQDWEKCLHDYDHPDTVFYLDPPYVDAHTGTYKHEMTKDDFRHFLDVIFHLKGFVALSGYSNPVIEERSWDDRAEWDSFTSIQSMSYSDGNNKSHLAGQEQRKHAREVLWIKEAE